MSIFTVLILMIFSHIVDDYYLQGILAKLKQKTWWKENAPDDKYKHDYIAALICHAFSWSIMILFPILIATSFNPAWWIYTVFVINTVIHAVIDDLKANKNRINLIQDQAFHFCQIFITWILFIIL